MASRHLLDIENKGYSGALGSFFDERKWQFYRIFGRFDLSSSQFDREQLTSLMHFLVIGECLGWRTTDFDELYGDLDE